MREMTEKNKETKKQTQKQSAWLSASALGVQTVRPTWFEDILWKFDTLCEHPLGKGEATCHSSWLYSLCTEDMWKVTARSHGRLVENVSQNNELL